MFGDSTPVQVMLPDRTDPGAFCLLPVVSVGLGEDLEAPDDPVLSIAFPLKVEWHDEPDPAPDDQYAIPHHVLGPIPDRFFEGIGRVIALSALMEDRLRTLLETIEFTHQGTYKKTPPSEVVAGLRAHAPSFGAPSLAARFEAFLDELGARFEYRNDLAHNLWSAKPDGQVYGHRQDRRSPERLRSTTNVNELGLAVVALSRADAEWMAWFARASSIAYEAYLQRTEDCQQPDE